MARRKKPGAPGRMQTTAPLPTDVPEANRSGETAEAKTISDVREGDSPTRVAKYHHWIDQSLRAQEEWQTAYATSMRILANDREGHWTAEALGALGNRPALIINHTTAKVLTVWGLQRRTRQIASFLPGDPEDAEAVELLQYLYRWEYAQLGLKELDSRIFLEKYAGGISFWKFLYDVSRDPRGKVKVKKPNPLSVLWDPNFPEVPWTEATYVICAEWYTIDDAVDAWPEHEGEIRSMTGNWIKGGATAVTDSLGDKQASHRFYWDPETQRVRIAQIYYKRTRTAEIALLGDGTLESDPDEVKALKKANADLKKDPAYKEALAGAEGGDMPAPVEFVRMPVTTVWYSHLLGHIELSHEPSPVVPKDELPVFPSMGHVFWKRPVGAVEYATDPQREKNKRRSVITEIAGRAAHNAWLDHESEGAGPEQFEKYASGASVRIAYQSVKPELVQPPQLPQYLVYLEGQSTEDIGKTMAITPEIEGQPKANVISGRAIGARQQAGQLSQEMFFDTFATEQSVVAKRICAMMKDKMTLEEARRILGALIQRNMNDPAAQKLMGLGDEALQKLLSRSFDAEFDVVFDTEPWDPSGKIAAARAVADMFQAVPPPPVPSLIIGFHKMMTELAIESGQLPYGVGKKWLDTLATAEQAMQAQEAAAADQGQPMAAGSAGNGEMPPTPPV
jgi:hypothetical protein